MKVDFNELFKKRWSLGRRFNEESNLVEDEMVEAAVSEGNNEFAGLHRLQFLETVSNTERWIILR